jgi:hypothetical protein
VFVADAFNNRVQEFGRGGRFLLKWGSGGTGDGRFNWATGVAVDRAGNVYVADYWNNRVQKFRPVASKSGTHSEVLSEALLLSSPFTMPGAGRDAQIVYTVSGPVCLDATVTNVAGRPVRRLARAHWARAGTSTLAWDGRSDQGTRVPSGLYLVRIDARAPDGRQQQAVTRCTIAR